MPLTMISGAEYLDALSMQQDDATFIRGLRRCANVVLEGGHDEPGGRTSWSIRERSRSPPTAWPPVVEPEAPSDREAPWSEDPQDPPRSWWRWTGGAIVVLMLFGAGFGAISLVGEDGQASVIRPPCPSQLFENPHENVCIEEVEMCHAWMRAPQQYRELSCGFTSDDGILTLSIDFTGQGYVTVALDRPDGQNIFYRIWGDERRVDVHDVLEGLRGPSGDWTMRIVFEDASGSADIRVYG